VLGESFVLIETGALGAVGELGLEPGTLGGFGVFGGLSGNLSFLFQNRIVNRSSLGIEVRRIFAFSCPLMITETAICPNSFSFTSLQALAPMDTSPIKPAHYIPTIQTAIWLQQTIMTYDEMRTSGLVESAKLH
jgi:hypothetical protein